MGKGTEHTNGVEGKRLLGRARILIAARRRFASRGMGAAVAMSLAACFALAAPSFASPPSAPFTECPAVGVDGSCAVLIVINSQGGLESYVDPLQPSYDGSYDELIGVKNDSSVTVPSIDLHGYNPFGFFGKGLCSGVNETGSDEGFHAPPEGCPFGPTGYEGPNTSFSNYKEEDLEENADTGTVNFTGGLAPGQTAYFSLAARPEVFCTETACESTTLSTTLTGEGLSFEQESGSSITVESGVPVSDSATIEGASAPVATGTVSYDVYSDASCTSLVDEAGEVSVSGANAPASEAKALPVGTYYWQASYTGDAHNGPSAGTCGSEVEHVVRIPTCSKLSGAAHYGSSPNKQTVHEKLVAPATPKKEGFGYAWEKGVPGVHVTQLNSATCTVKKRERVFTGQGEAAKRTEKGYKVSFTITTVGTQPYLSLTLEKGNTVIKSVSNEPLINSKTNPEKIS